MSTLTDWRPEESERGSLRDALQVIAHWKWLIVAFIVVMTVAAAALSLSRTKQYTATTALKYEKQIDVSNPLGVTSQPNVYQAQLELQGVASELANPDVKAQAARQLDTSANDPKLAVSVEVVPDTSVANLSAVADSPDRAAGVANAFAAAFIAANKERQRERLQQAEVVVENRLKGFTSAESRTSADYILLSERLRDLQIAAATVTGDYRVISPAAPPASPSSPKPVRDAGIGLAVGLFGGVGLAFVLEQLNTRLRSRREVADILQLPVVGRVPRIPKSVIKSGPLAVLTEPDGNAAESLRMLRNNLDYLSVDANLSTVLFTSCTRDEGKSVTVCNLAVTLAMGGKKVIVVDGDLRRPRMHAYFGLPNQTGLSTVLAGKTDLEDVLRPFPLPTRDWQSPAGGNGSGADGAGGNQPRRLYVVTSGPLPPNPGELIASERFAQILENLRKHADVILIDAPAFMPVSDAAALAPRVDGVFMVVNMENATRSMLVEGREFLNQLPCRKLGVIVTRERASRGDYYSYYGHSSAEKVKI